MAIHKDLVLVALFVLPIPLAAVLGSVGTFGDVKEACLRLFGLPISSVIVGGSTLMALVLGMNLVNAGGSGSLSQTLVAVSNLLTSTPIP